jgi:IclR family transcriptional regulator, pca regulon regulatory protein
LRSIAVPVHDQNGRVIAAINVSTQSARVTMKELLLRILPEVRLTASDLSLVLPRNALGCA